MKALLFLAGLLAVVAAQAAPVRVLFVTGSSDSAHKWQESTASILGILEGAGRFAVRTTEDPASLAAAGALADCDVLFVNYNGPRWPRAAEAAVEAFVAGGGGLVSFHQASYGTFFGHEKRDTKWHDGPPGSGWTAWPRMIGATWEAARLGHAKRGTFTVDWKVRDHPVSRGLPASFEADDELYHKLTLLPGAVVLADAFSDPKVRGTGNREPQVWINAFGRGRVLFTTLGHDARAFQKPGMAALFANATEWAATGAVKSR